MQPERRSSAGVVDLKTRYPGFSLIELLLVCSVLALLGLMVISGYSNARIKSQRYDAMFSLLEEQWLLERCYEQDGSYDGPCISDRHYPHPSKMRAYRIILISQSKTRYLIGATPVGNQSQDSTCMQWTISHSNIKKAFNARGAEENSCWG